MDWAALASRLNQLALLPFLGFLATLHRLQRLPRAGDAGISPAAPPGLARAFSGVLLFVAAAIPAGAWCARELHERLANVDAVHGACEALLTAANLAVVMSLRAGVRAAEAEAAAAGERGDGDPPGSGSAARALPARGPERAGGALVAPRPRLVRGCARLARAPRLPAAAPAAVLPRQHGVVVAVVR